MIAVRLQGGLGNQLFQYAAGRALALRHETDLVLDTSTLLRKDPRVTQREMELYHFRVAARVATTAESRLMPFLHLTAPVSRWISPWLTFVEKGVHFNAAFSTLPDQTYLVGYWQSYRYFVDIAPQLASELLPVASLSECNRALAHEIEGCESVAVHVRRGDYVSLGAAAELHGALPLSYYQTAIARLCKKVARGKAYVFTDDPAWCRQHLTLPGMETELVHHNLGGAAWQDLVLMARCRHHVIANSSFSWWGAWLADAYHGWAPRHVLAPSRWFSGQPRLDVRDRFPSQWSMIDVS